MQPNCVSVLNDLYDAYHTFLSERHQEPDIGWYRTLALTSGHKLVKRTQRWLDDFQLKPEEIRVVAWPPADVMSALRDVR